MRWGAKVRVKACGCFVGWDAINMNWDSLNVKWEVINVKQRKPKVNRVTIAYNWVEPTVKREVKYIKRNALIIKWV